MLAACRGLHLLTDMQLDSRQPACNAQMLNRDSELWDRHQE